MLLQTAVFLVRGRFAKWTSCNIAVFMTSGRNRQSMTAADLSTCARAALCTVLLCSCHPLVPTKSADATAAAIAAATESLSSFGEGLRWFRHLVTAASAKPCLNLTVLVNAPAGHAVKAEDSCGLPRRLQS